MVQPSAAASAGRYRAFLSYSHADRGWASWLHKTLETYRVPSRLVGMRTDVGVIPRRLSPVFRDREELASAADLGARVREALERSDILIVSCSPSAARSRWVNEEILTFKRLGREDRIFCLIIAGEPNASEDPARAHDECFPRALRYRLGPDGQLSSVRAEPIAADARRGKDGRGNARLKLIAGMLGVGFDALRQREQQRRNRQLFAIAASALVGMVLTTALAAAALIARATAQRETALARVDAETARQTSDFLVDLFSISNPSEARGNKVTAREMLDKGAARIRTKLAGQPRIQATLMGTLGSAYMGLGLYREAEPLLESAVAVRRALQPPEPAHLSVALNRLGRLQRLRAQYPAADQSYRQAVALLGSLRENPRNDGRLARSYMGLGSELAAQGRFNAAERSLRAALTLEHVDFPGANEYTARTLEALGKVLDRLGHLDEALPLMQQAVTMQRSLWGTQPYPNYADAINDLGLLDLEKGDYPQAERLFRESIDMMRRLYGSVHPEIATALNNLALVREDEGNLAGAESAYRQALAMQRKLLGDAHPLVANTLNNLAYVRYENGEVRKALATERGALAIYRKLFPGDSPQVAGVLNTMGYWFIQDREYSAAQRYIEEGLAMRQRIFGKFHPEVAASLTHLAVLRIATHHYDAALSAARAAARIWSTKLPASAWKVALAQGVEGAAFSGMGDYTEANRLLVHSRAVLDSDPGAFPMYRALIQRYLEQLNRNRKRDTSARMPASADAPGGRHDARRIGVRPAARRAARVSSNRSVTSEVALRREV